ncbi:TetR family transcriptional regulator (plasmid) [Deinococcus aetherius]|uniref:TetR family transcriptional regulator n=1 Tax=Deinococcus aetherius TaxID=200252 RepID=A0ABM8AJA7_9DEIO|nr:TetR/AcrR family transcriptional regulator [Deinococcus aetherius]BDP43903.1 TetR family transcriptional regulator [Deinococcus aetherius]
MPERPTTKAAQRERTVQSLIVAGRELFTERGYAHTSTADLVERAGVTRGALYHHFKDKQDLFVAVLGAVQAEVAVRVELAASQGADPWAQLRLGCQAFMRASLDPEVRRIMLLDGPAVVGWRVWRDLDQAHAVRSLREGLLALQKIGELRDVPLGASVHLLSGAMNEAALWIAQSPQPDAALAEAGEALDVLLESLRA